MPPFTQECAAARSQFQAAWDAWGAALRAAGSARRARNRAQREADEANRAHQQARDARVTAETNWDAQTTAIQADPTFGVAGVTAGVIPAGTEGPPASGNAGPYPLSNGASFSLWVQSDSDAALTRWHTAADAALQATIQLAGVAADARTEEADRQGDAQDAQAVLDQAEQALTQAENQAQQAEAAVDAAEAQVETACSGQTESSGLDGGELVVHPGVLPEDEERVRDKLDDIPDEEKEGLGRIELTDREGRPMSYDDPNEGTEVNTQAGGTYSNGVITIYDQKGEGVEDIIKHEMGHHVYDKRLPPPARQLWRDFWNEGDNKLKPPDGKMPTGYAGSSAGEGFAEVYEYYHDYPDRLDPETRQKIEQLLGMIQ